MDMITALNICMMPDSWNSLASASGRVHATEKLHKWRRKTNESIE